MSASSSSVSGIITVVLGTNGGVVADDVKLAGVVAAGVVDLTVFADLKENFFFVPADRFSWIFSS